MEPPTKIPTASEQIGFLLQHMTEERLRRELNDRRIKDGLRIKREAVVLYELYLEEKEKSDAKT